MNKNKVTLYHEASSGGFKQWSIWIEKDHTTVSVEWGKVGCTLQTSSDTTKPKGKLGTAAFMDERACAQFNYERQLRKKREEGYRDTMDDADDQDLFAGLTKRFVPAKPRNDVDEETLFKLDYDRKLWVQRKRDGQRHLVLITKTGKVKIYSRRMDDMTKHFPKLCASIEYLGLPKRTILDGEIIVDRDGADDFRAVGTVTRSKAEKAAGREKDLPIRFMAFDLLYYAGAETWKASYEQRYTTLAALLAVSVPSVFVPKILERVRHLVASWSVRRLRVGKVSSAGSRMTRRWSVTEANPSVADVSSGSPRRNRISSRRDTTLGLVKCPRSSEG